MVIILIYCLKLESDYRYESAGNTAVIAVNMHSYESAGNTDVIAVNVYSYKIYYIFY